MKRNLVLKLGIVLLVLAFVVESQAALVDPRKAQNRKNRKRGAMFSKPAAITPRKVTNQTPTMKTDNAATATSATDETPAVPKKKKY